MTEPTAIPPGGHLLATFGWVIPDAPDADGDTYAESALDDLCGVVGRPAWIRGDKAPAEALFGTVIDAKRQGRELMLTVDVYLDNPKAVALATRPQLAGGPEFQATEFQQRRDPQGKITGLRFIHVVPLGWGVAEQLPTGTQPSAHDA